MAKQKVHAKKSLGQNFLVDRQVIDDIIFGSDVGEEDLVIEIGPGTGALTKGLAKVAGKVIAIELDDKLVNLLNEHFAGKDKVTILHGDILKTDVAELIQKARAENPALTGVQIIGNLPYYITTPIMMGLLEADIPFTGMTFMMQKEVGDRILATPSHKSYGALSVAVQYYCEVEKIRDVSAACFRPRPKVESIVLRLTKRQEKAVNPKDTKIFFACIKAAFAMRRKTLLNCFTGVFGLDKEDARTVLNAAGIDPTLRGEALTIEQFAVLADTVAEHLAAEGQND